LSGSTSATRGLHSSHINDLWIAATAAAHRLPVVAKDADFDVWAEIGGIEIIRV
jgi:predicted nucleic acid-binding protein